MSQRSQHSPSPNLPHTLDRSMTAWSFSASVTVKRPPSSAPSTCAALITSS